jgi:hypothetical protein
VVESTLITMGFIFDAAAGWNGAGFLLCFCLSTLGYTSNCARCSLQRG